VSNGSRKGAADQDFDPEILEVIRAVERRETLREFHPLNPVAPGQALYQNDLISRVENGGDAAVPERNGNLHGLSSQVSYQQLCQRRPEQDKRLE